MGTDIHGAVQAIEARMGGLRLAIDKRVGEVERTLESFLHRLQVGGKGRPGTIAVKAGDGRTRVKLFGSSGVVLLTGTTAGGEIDPPTGQLLGAPPTRPTGTIRLDGSRGSVDIGGNGACGRLDVLDEEGKNLVEVSRTDLTHQAVLRVGDNTAGGAGWVNVEAGGASPGVNIGGPHGAVTAGEVWAGGVNLLDSAQSAKTSAAAALNRVAALEATVAMLQEALEEMNEQVVALQSQIVVDTQRFEGHLHQPGVGYVTSLDHLKRLLGLGHEIPPEALEVSITLWRGITYENGFVNTDIGVSTPPVTEAELEAIANGHKHPVPSGPQEPI